MTCRSEESSFVRALRDYGLERCSLSGTALCIGLPPDPEYGRTPVTGMPDAPARVCFFEGPLQAELAAALVASPEAAAVRRLVVGTTHDYAVRRRGNLDMAAATAELARGRFPALRRLVLGDMEMLFNGHRLFGAVGDVTPLFAAAPELEELDLHGHFTVARAVRHDRLRRFSAELDDVGVSGGPLSQESLSHLLSSRFPRLETLRLSLEESDREADYVVPETFFAGDGFPALIEIAIDCLAPADEARLNAWEADRRHR